VDRIDLAERKKVGGSCNRGDEHSSSCIKCREMMAAPGEGPNLHGIGQFITVAAIFLVSTSQVVKLI
jgi:hypothetical protein